MGWNLAHHGPAYLVELLSRSRSSIYRWWLRMKSSTGFGSLRDSGK